MPGHGRNDFRDCPVLTVTVGVLRLNYNDVVVRAEKQASFPMKLSVYALQLFAVLPIRKKTLATYRSMFRCHIEGALGEIQLSEISRSDIKKVISNLPPQTAATTLAIIKMIFREALEDGIVEKSPVHGLRGPKVMVAPRRFLTWEELDRINFGKWNHQIRFLALHGLRWSEAVALTVDDIRGGRIYVTKSVHGATKSLAGMRVVPLVGEFKKFPRHPRTLRKALSPHGITIHSLRHTYAYILKKQGVHVTTAQRLLGHSDPKVTLAVYTRVLDSEIDDVARIMDTLIGDEKSDSLLASA